jgi:hypothetical protein
VQPRSAWLPRPPTRPDDTRTQRSARSYRRFGQAVYRPWRVGKRRKTTLINNYVRRGSETVSKAGPGRPRDLHHLRGDVGDPATCHIQGHFWDAHRLSGDPGRQRGRGTQRQAGCLFMYVRPARLKAGCQTTPSRTEPIPLVERLHMSNGERHKRAILSDRNWNEIRFQHI